MSNNVDNPLKWLLAQLPNYVPEHLLPVLLRTYEVNKAAYARQVAINRAERIIATTERFAPSADRDARLARWRQKLAILKAGEM